jgi:hypothetical protein
LKPEVLVRGVLGLVDDEFKYVSGLLALDAVGRALGNQLARNHHSQPIALLKQPASQR